MGPDYLPEGGTNYRALLETAIQAFGTSTADRYLIILSDGEATDDDWKPLVMRLKHPPSPPAIRLERRAVRCHIQAMASSSAVRADNPFEEVRAPVRGTVAIDMEGAAFGLVMSRHPLIPWLVAKGVWR